MIENPDSKAPRRGPSSEALSELALRTVSSLVLGGLVIALTIRGGWPFTALWLIAGLAVLVEWCVITRVAPRYPLVAALGTAIVLLATAFLLRWPLWAFLGIMGAAAAAAHGIARNRDDAIWSLAGALTAAVIALMPSVLLIWPLFGVYGLLWMFTVIWSTDIAAYIAGRLIGGPKLAPVISPKKTWAGFFGGILLGTCAGTVMASYALPPDAPHVPSFAKVAALSLLASFASQMGDLAESGFKRLFGVKDSGRLIPGHGGAMDRLDSFWAVCLLMALVLIVGTVWSA